MRSGIGRPLEVPVDGGGVERAIRKLKRKMADEGLLRELKRRRYYEKPSERKKRKEREARRRTARQRAAATRRQGGKGTAERETGLGFGGGFGDKDLG